MNTSPPLPVAPDAPANDLPDAVAPSGGATRLAADGQTPFILMIDDQPIMGEAVRRLLADMPDLDFHYVADPLDAVATVRQIKPAVVLLDLVMPAKDGLTVLREIRADASIANTPVVMLSTTDDAATKASAFDGGADDYLVKLPDKVELRARARYHARNSTVQRERDAAMQALRESQRRLQELNLQLLQLSQVDGLTGLSNRRYFDESMQSEVRRAARSGQPMSLLMVDIDHFKAFNDSYGHQDGDTCLKAVAQSLRSSAQRVGDVTARYGGEEFAVILPVTDAEAAAKLADAACQTVYALNHPHLGSPMGRVTISVGHATWLPSERSLEPEQLIELADKALYRAKKGGRNQASA